MRLTDQAIEISKHYEHETNSKPWVRHIDKHDNTWCCEIPKYYLGKLFNTVNSSYRTRYLDLVIAIYM